MCSPDAPPAPAPDPQIGESAKMQAELGKEYLAFAKEQGAAQAALGQEYLDFAKNQFAISSAMQADINALAKEVSTTFLDMSKEDRSRWETVFKPLEDDFVKLAKEYASPEKQEQAAAAAKADVMRQSELERGAQERRSSSYGIRPDSGNYQGIDRAIGLGTTIASVDAQNRAREGVRNTGMALQRDVIGLGSNLRGGSANYLSGALGAAGVPLANLNASQSIVAPGFGGAMAGLSGQAATTGAGYGGAMTGYNNQGNILNNLYKNNIGVWETQAKMDAANAAGIGNFAGTALGAISGSGSMNSILGKGLSVALPFVFSSKKAKQNRKDVPEGESLAAVEKMPVQTYDYKPGIADGGHHVGPMAEDFKAATGKGDGMTIAVQDAIGVTMGAVKDLARKVDRMAEMVGLGPRAKPATA